MTPIIYKLTDNVLIKGSNSSNSPQTVSVQTIVNYAIAQGYGNAFMLIDGGSSFSGSAIRFFTISGNTAYLGSTDFLSLNPYNTGISDGTSTNSNITDTTNVGYSYNGSSFNTISVAFNWGTYTKNNIKYYTQGGNTSANYGYQTGYYLPDTITNVYIDEEPLVTHAWEWLQSIGGNTFMIPPVAIVDIDSDSYKFDSSTTVHGNTGLYEHKNSSSAYYTYTLNINENFSIILSTSSSYAFEVSVNNVVLFGGTGLSTAMYGQDFGFMINYELEEASPCPVWECSSGQYQCIYALTYRDGSNYADKRKTLYQAIMGAMHSSVTAPGGGATHIAKVTGHLSALSSNLSDILIVAGGGGGGMIVDSVAYDGADAGGISGNGTNSANQTTGYAFGQGESGSGVSGGGGGLYGGYKGVGGSSPSPVPPEYQSYIDALNGEGFFFKDWESGDYTDQYFQSISTTNFSQYSYVCYGTSNNIEEGIANYYNSGYDNYYKKYCSGHICTDAKVYIVSSGSVSYPYSYTATFTISNTTNTGYWGVQNDDINIYIYNNTNYINGGAQTDRHGQTFTYQSGSFQTLADALANVVCCNRNIDLYVDGVQWASACRT